MLLWFHPVSPASAPEFWDTRLRDLTGRGLRQASVRCYVLYNDNNSLYLLPYTTL